MTDETFPLIECLEKNPSQLKSAAKFIPALVNLFKKQKSKPSFAFPPLSAGIYLLGLTLLLERMFSVLFSSGGLRTVQNSNLLSD